MQQRTLPNGVIERWQFQCPLRIGYDDEGEPRYDFEGGGYAVRWDYGSFMVSGTLTEQAFERGDMETWLRDEACACLLDKAKKGTR